MPTVAVLNSQGGEVAKVDLNPAVFEADINTNCVRAAVNRQLARRRQGTVGSKNKALVSGGGAKPWRQKGTGRARCGSNRSPIWRGGGTIFGPQARSYGGMINRKVTRSAILSCLSSYVAENRMIVVDAIDFPEPKTKQVIEFLNKLNLADASRILVMTEDTNLNLALSARNLPMVDVINCDNINVFDLTTHDALVTTSAAVKRLEETYA